MTYVITQSCCNDASCVEECPVDCIHPSPDEPDFATAEMLYINPDDCIDCGACVEACPVGAVHAEDELPDHLSDYAAMNADYFSWIGDAIPDPVPLRRPGPRVDTQSSPLRVAVVGSGPAGCFVADELAGTRRADVEVTLLDRLATPFGLVRNGVAPDHLSTKGVNEMFSAVAGHRGVAVRLNVEIGREVSHQDLLGHHHAVVYATGAAEGRALGIPGEQLVGSYPAAEFVGWYNGHPDRAGLEPELAHARAVVVGNGNVALDIARLLLIGPAALQASDMAPGAVEAIAAAEVDEVVVLGRRGPEHAACTAPELLALVNHPDIEVVVDPADLVSLDGTDGPRTAAGFAAAQKAELLRRSAARSGTAAKRLVLRFGVTPRRVLGIERVAGVELVATGVEGAEPELVQAGLLVRATGYRGTAVDGVPFDDQAGRFAHEAGRVVDPKSAAPVTATYTTGWAKRGPSGVIGTNRQCAAETAAAVLDDYHAGQLPDPGGDAASFDDLLTSRGVSAVDLSGWQRLDQHERGAGEQAGRPRVKVVDHDEQVRIGLAG